MPGFGRFGRPSKPLMMAVGIMVVLIVAWIVVGRFATRLNKAKHRNVAEAVSAQLRSGAAKVDMTHAADFAWDEMFVFNPYYPKNDICKTLKISSSQCAAGGISDVGEGEFLLVFMQRGAISDTVRFPRTIADFDESDRCLARPFRRNTALFTLKRKPALYLVCQ